MNDIFGILAQLLNGEVIKNLPQNVTIREDKDGNVTIKYSNPKNSKIVKKIKSEIENIDDDIFTRAVEIFMKADKESYNIMANLENIKDIPALEKAYKVFQSCVSDAAQEEIKKLTDRVNYLFNKYCSKEECGN